MTKIRVDMKKLEEKLGLFLRSATRVTADNLPKDIVDDIEQGISPVKNKGRFERYSDSYRKQIDSSSLLKAVGKRVSPVNMKVSGQLLNSIYARVKKGRVIVGFKDRLADIHNRLGAGKKAKTVRRLLPTEDKEVFNRGIQIKLEERVKRVARRIFNA